MTLSNCIQRDQPKRRQSGSNYEYKDSNLSIYRTNSSQNNSVLSSINTIKGFSKVMDSEFSFSDVTRDITHLFDFSDSEKQDFTSHDNKRYYGVLSKNVSGQASRYLLAFFVPDSSTASQANTMPSSITLNASKKASREQYLIFIVAFQGLLTNYEGLTLQNKRAERRICRAVTNVTESKASHPILLPYSVIFTQKTLGGYHA